MIPAVRDRIDAFLGRGRHSAAVPVMDGPLQPDQRLEEAKAAWSAPALDNLLVTGSGTVLFSSGPRLMQGGTGAATEVLAEFDQDITCLATSGAGALAVGLAGQGIMIRGGRHDGQTVTTLGSAPFVCPTAALFLDEDTLLVASGSEVVPPGEWKRDLLSLGQSGSVWRIDLASDTPTQLASSLAYPYGLAAAPEGVLVSEAWRHRLVLLHPDGRPAASVLDDLPAYPSRILPAASGGYWLALFAPRNQLLEFVLRERGYREAMMRSVDPAHWVAPSLASRASFKEVLQYGGVKHMGILKPWAPTWSYGLVALLGPDFNPVASWHSRADGGRHGVTSLAERDGELLVGAKGAGLVLRVDPRRPPQEPR